MLQRARAAARDARRRPRHRQEPARLRALPDDRDRRLGLVSGATAARSRTARASRFWALGEMVKAQAGILESDGPGEAARSSRQAVRRGSSTMRPRPRWVERHLRPLVGLDAEATRAGDRRDEAFAAWRRFLEAIAERAPARPRLRGPALGRRRAARLRRLPRRLGERRAAARRSARRAPSCSPGGPAGAAARRTRRRSCSRRSPRSETAALLHALLGRSVDRRRRSRRGSRARRRQPALRGGVHADAADGPGEACCPRPCRASSPPGSTRSPRGEGAAPGRGGRREGLLARRARRVSAGRSRSGCTARAQGVRHAASAESSVAGEDEYAFRHALVRDVAYEQIPRRSAPSKHRARPSGSSRWAGPRTTPRCSPTTTPLRSTTPVRPGRTRDRLAEQGRHRASRGRRSRLLAQRIHRGRALLRARGRVLAARRPRAAELLFKLARTYHVSGDGKQHGSLEDARNAALAAERPELAAEADALLAELWWYRADRARADRHLERARALVQDQPPSPWKAHVLSQVSRYACWRALTKKRFGSVKRRSPWPRSSGSRSSRRMRSTTSVRREPPWATPTGSGPRACHQDRGSGRLF